MFPAVQERIPAESAYFKGIQPVPDDLSSSPNPPYRGRIAPTPSGWLHLGHAATFRIAWERARQAGGRLVYRTEDIDPDRCRPEYAAGAMEDLRWWGLDWDEGPDCGGPFAPYTQSERLEGFRLAFERLRLAGHIYPSPHSRKEIAGENPVPSPVDGDPLFPVALRPSRLETGSFPPQEEVNWRFRVPDGRSIAFSDQRCGWQCLVAGQDFGDFLVWKRNGWPAYELAVVVDDQAMGITEVVRGEDLLLSTARQLLLYEALGWTP
ncbi:MAG TPA: glutamate--tRNA ligase family protein, partial [Oceanipulchritudo sp.]|nr:glutamate--tRNA ligase family protein [Oceanipulchritudo sp.]